MRFVLVLVLCACRAPAAPIANQAPPVAPSRGIAKLDANLASIYGTWAAHHGPADREQAKHWVRRGEEGTMPTNDEMRKIEAARLVLEPVVDVSIDVESRQDAATLEALGFKLWVPEGEPSKVHLADFDRDVVRVYISKLRLELIEQLVTNDCVIRVNYAPTKWMQAYREPELF